jgi:hypothetical protein
MKLIPPQKWHERHSNPKAIEDEIRGDNGRGWLMRWLPSRAHDSGLFYVFSNGVGIDAAGEEVEIRTGNAMILDCYGRILKETWRAADDMVVADCDLGLLDRSQGARWLRARRPELYSLLSTPTGIEVDPRTARFSEAPTRGAGGWEKTPAGRGGASAVRAGDAEPG